MGASSFEIALKRCSFASRRLMSAESRHVSTMFMIFGSLLIPVWKGFFNQYLQIHLRMKRIVGLNIVFGYSPLYGIFDQDLSSCSYHVKKKKPQNKNSLIQI